MGFRMPPYNLTRSQWRNAALLGLAMALAYLALMFGPDVLRYRAMAQALDAADMVRTAKP
jgi:hypothetical protein